MHFGEALVRAVDRVGSPVCVGIDPVFERLPDACRAQHWHPPQAIEAFSMQVMDLVVDRVPAVKLQAACFERYGHQGVLALEHACTHALDLGLLVILDAKRGDIGISAQHYAASVKHLGAHAVTVNIYLGPETARPYLDADLGIFALVRTSNPESDVVQSRRLDDGRTVAEMVAAHVDALGADDRPISRVGAVVGATKSDDGEALRDAMPHAPILIPGYGAQGGGADDIIRLARTEKTTLGTAGVLVTASRSITYPTSDLPWADAVRAEAEQFAEDVATALS